jgi:hypothetical protein
VGICEKFASPSSHLFTGSPLHLGDGGTKSFVEMLVANCTMTQLRFGEFVKLLTYSHVFSEAIYQNDKQIVDALEENFSLIDVTLCNYSSDVIEVAQVRIGLRNQVCFLFACGQQY